MILVADGNHLVHLFWHMAASKIRHETGEQDPQPDIADVLDWFLTRLDNLRLYLSDREPDLTCFCAFDSTSRPYRCQIVEDYKAGRTRYAGVIEAVREAKEAVSASDEWIGLVSPDGLEADDVMASIAYQSPGRVVIHSPDKDLNQCLVAGRVTIIKKSGMTEPEVNRYGIQIGADLACEYFAAADLREKYGFGPERWVDYQCLVGDSADNIKGAKWIGDMAARRIIATKKPLEDVDPVEAKLNARQQVGWLDFIERLNVLREIFTLRNDLSFQGEKLWN